ncbi:major facilitator superfamily domain, general substrate transporter [Trichoderma arundinaceum]|uniref:Major facilitator superfamily domain, general substrate transporter n=1 Tax=Trichoderma arundinaceum TaxID=490622 RepID=A0A395NUH8_TRIAR|nr:major facilitator superfamily domain, general substrate transporter [Trichoderma arundinaceum]
MAGGNGVNVFKILRGDEPKAIFNWRLWFAVCSFGLMGAARGIDEGLIAGVVASSQFQSLVGIADRNAAEAASIKGNIVAMVNIGSVGGAIIAFFICDRIGRLWATRQLCLVWMIGIAIFMGNNGSLGAVYAGRFIAGLGVGQTTVVAPVYLAEISPPSVRGLATCFFTGAVYLGIVLSYFANYGCALHFPEGYARWEVPTSLHLIFAGLILMLSFFNYESPRYFIKAGQPQLALENLCRLRQLPEDDKYIKDEIEAINTSLQVELEATMGLGFIGFLKEMFLIPGNLYRIYIGVTGQLLSQWSGGPSITVYALNLFAILGITGSGESLLSTAVFGVVKLISAFICALFLVDIVGRKMSLLAGISLQAIAIVYIAIYLTIVPTIAKSSAPSINGSSSAGRAGIGAIVCIFVSGFGWAMGWNSMQYLLTAELFPLRIRAASTSLVMCVHFLNSYANSRAVPVMLLPTTAGGLSPAGTFWFFSAITIIGGLWVWLTIPETSGRRLESIDELFSLPWYKIGLHGNKIADENNRNKLDGNSAILAEKKLDVQHEETKEKV